MKDSNKNHKNDDSKKIKNEEIKGMNNKNNKNNEKNNNSDIYPGELLEKRKISKSKDLPFKYECQKSMKPYNYEITCMLLIKSANLIATTSLIPNIDIWSFNPKEINLNLISILKGHTKTIICLKEFFNINCIASCSYDNTLKLWDIIKKECIKTLNYNSKSILTCCYNPNYNMEIYTAGDDMEILVWGGSPKNYNYIPKNKIKVNKKNINHLFFVGDFNLLVSGSKDNCLCFWDCNNNYACVDTIDFGSEIKCLKYLEKRLMVSCSDGNINFINMNILKKVKSVQFGNTPICDFEIINQQYILMGCEDGKVRLWKFCTENRTLLIGHKKAVIGVGVIDINQDYIITASKDCTIKIWEKIII